MDKNSDWAKVLKLIREQISGANYGTWFGNTEGTRVGENFVIRVSSSFNKQNLISKYQDLIEKTVADVLGQPLTVQYLVKQSQQTDQLDGLDLEFSAPALERSQAGLNPRLNLGNFVVGVSNNLAYAAAQAVINNPGLSYNPLFIYGGTGVGKTHLMNGIGNAILAKNPRMRAIYCPLERFMNDFVQSIQNKKMGDFRSRYRNMRNIFHNIFL